MDPALFYLYLGSVFKINIELLNPSGEHSFALPVQGMMNSTHKLRTSSSFILGPSPSPPCMGSSQAPRHGLVTSTHQEPFLELCFQYAQTMSSSTHGIKCRTPALAFLLPMSSWVAFQGLSVYFPKTLKYFVKTSVRGLLATFPRSDSGE